MQRAALLLFAAVGVLQSASVRGLCVSRRRFGGLSVGGLSTVPLGASAAPKKYSEDDARRAIAEIKAARLALNDVGGPLGKGDFQGAATLLEAPAIA